MRRQQYPAYQAPPHDVRPPFTSPVHGLKSSFMRGPGTPPHCAVRHPSPHTMRPPPAGMVMRPMIPQPHMTRRELPDLEESGSQPLNVPPYKIRRMQRSNVVQNIVLPEDPPSGCSNFYTNEVGKGFEKFVCEACDRDFPNSHAYEIHMQQHIVCNIDGCKFTAHEKIVQMHIKTQHSTGLYYKICNLSTPEDIRNWREQRRLKYPTKENIFKRQEQQVEMFKRGEKLTKKKSNFKTKSKLQRIKKTKKHPDVKLKQKSKPPIKKPFIDDQADWNCAMFPFKGTAEIYNIIKVENKDNFEDAEWEDAPTPNSNKLILKNALGSLMSAYNSSDESDNEQPPPKTTKLNVETKPEVIDTIKESTSDNELPLEEKISKNPLSEPVKHDDLESSKCPSIKSESNKRKRKRTHFKKIRNIKVEKDVKDSDSFSNKKFVKRRATLLEKLLENEIRHERNVLLQCVRYVVSNNYFQ